MSREAFEKIYPCGHNYEFNEVKNRYQPLERPYIFGGDKASDEQNIRWQAWQHQQATITQQQEELKQLRAFISECDDYLDTHKETTIGHLSILHRNMKAINQRGK